MTKEKVQCNVRKIKSKLTIEKNKRFYPSSSCLGKFYGTVKPHKIDSKRLVDDLPIRHINLSSFKIAGKVIGTLKRKLI